MSRKGQRRTLDEPSQQPETEIVVKTPEPIEVDGVLIKPHDLHDFVLAGGPLPREEALVHQCEPVVRRRITIGRSAIKGCACRTYPDCQDSASEITGPIRPPHPPPPPPPPPGGGPPRGGGGGPGGGGGVFGGAPANFVTCRVADAMTY